LARAAYYVAQNPEIIEQTSIEDIAKASGAGEATVIRLCQSLGFDGFRSFQLAMTRELERERVLLLSPDPAQETQVQDARLSKIALELETTIAESAGRSDPDRIKELCHRLRRASRVIAFGAGVSNLCSDLLAVRLAFLGILVHVPRTGLQAHEIGDHLSKGDVTIGISSGGLSQDTVSLLEKARSRGSHTFAITTEPDSPLGHAAATVIELSVFGGWPKTGSARLLPAMALLTEFAALQLEKDADGV